MSQSGNQNLKKNTKEENLWKTTSVREMGGTLTAQETVLSAL